MRLAGTLCHWNDARGFGFIAGPDGKRYFVHINSIAGIATRPRHGDTVTFLPASGREGRPEARQVQIDGANPVDLEAIRNRGRVTQVSLFGWRTVAAAVLVVLLAIALVESNAPLWLAGLYSILGAASFVLYRGDKAAATAGRWRTSEVTLLALDLCFGIAGGLLAQQIYRHKTRKAGYVTTAMLLTVVHVCWLAGLAAGLITTAEVANLIYPLVAGRG